MESGKKILNEGRKKEITDCIWECWFSGGAWSIVLFFGQI